MSPLSPLYFGYRSRRARCLGSPFRTGKAMTGGKQEAKKRREDGGKSSRK